jgi:hypothetical protein
METDVDAAEVGFSAHCIGNKVKVGKEVDHHLFFFLAGAVGDGLDDQHIVMRGVIRLDVHVLDERMGDVFQGEGFEQHDEFSVQVGLLCRGDHRVSCS